MAKKVLILSGSPRKGGNSDTLCDQFMKGAQEAGNEAEDTDTVMNCTLECFRGLAECLEGSVEKGVIYGKGVYAKDEIAGHPAMKQGYEMGKSIK